MASEYSRKANNSTNYVHPNEEHLLNLHHAMGYNPYGRPIVTVDDATVQHTSLNRRKVSTSRQTFFNTFQYNKDPLIWDEATTGTAESVFDEYAGGLFLTVGNSAGDEIVRQTRNVVRYIPGSANEAIFVVRLNEFEPGIRKRFGVFDEDNGVYFEKGVDDYYVAIRRNTPTGLNERRVKRADWNVDRLDGTGPSGLTLQETSMQMFAIEYEWYGAGVVEFKLVFDNNAYPLHRFNSGNIEDLPWSNTPFVPMRFELTNVDGVVGDHQILQGSSAVNAEGSAGPLGREENVTTPLTGITVSTANEFRPVLSIRLRPDRLRGVILPLQFQLAALDNSAIFYKITRDAQLVGADFQPLGANSFADFDISATDFTDGEPIQTGYISPSSQGQTFGFPEDTILQLGRNDLGTTPQNFTILAASISANKEVFASLSWVEVR